MGSYCHDADVCLSVTVYCGETAERIEMPLGMEVDVGQVTKNMKGLPDPPREGGNCPPKFRPYGVPSGPAGRASECVHACCVLQACCVARAAGLLRASVHAGCKRTSAHGNRVTS